MCISAGPESPEFSYSVGLYLTLGHPEIITFGLPATKAGQIINSVRDLVRAGAAFPSGSTSTEVLQGLPVSFVDVPIEQYRNHLGFALWFYRSLLPDAFPCVQLVWPDRSGLFPWQPGFAEELKPLQPVLGGLA